jgi:DNA-directed RNA polymerase alpha subunit
LTAHPALLKEGTLLAEARDWTLEPISVLGMSTRVQRCVESVGVATIGELCALTEDEFLAGRGSGETTQRELRGRLADLGLRMRNNKPRV